ncbi:hypothetical protein E3T23_03410 [Cryobacterium cheniae]|uniref:Uncharacterized protein n=1 Tax=Cryobacterium cheniae TaxID=1259262 RepID=A0A4R8XYM2_9MICO|nr:hypothetical protein [Cryobacterium cheniae]TFC82987.1 hypothetical protein E3T23_03410 [Cryobacterium cheniae]
MFLLADIALIAFALNSTRPGVTAEAPRSAPRLAATSDPATTPDPAAKPAAPTGVAVPPARFLSAVDDTTAWRVVTGECPATPATPELTTDSGATWESKSATGPTEVTAPQALKATSESIIEFVGLSATDCAPEFVQTFVGGDTFKSYPEKLGGAWFVNPADRAVVHSPAGDAAAPCPAVIALAPRDANSAAVLCDEQTIFTTTNAAATWSSAVTVPGAVNLNMTQAGYIIVAVGLPECAGVQLVALPAESPTVTSAGCLLVDTPMEIMPGNVAVSEASGTLWLWAGNELKRSSDGGMAWQ